MRKTKLLSLLVLLLTAVTQGTWAQKNLLDGVFSVSATKKVSFAQGNLQATYNGSDWSWAFAEHQWDYIGNAAGNTKVTASSPYISENATVDLFGWVGASSTWTGVNKYGITSSSATNNKNGYGNVASESLKSDWGALIGLGWRTLSMAEWTYLLTTRTVNGGKGADKSYTLNQSVNGKKGMVIYPDNYTGAVYSGDNWASFEAAGCVFLPAAGWRDGTTIKNINDRGFYWSSTPATTTEAKRMFFAGGLNLSDTNSRAYGFSVRLVKEYSLSTDATGDFIIASKADWEKFCSDINNGSTYSGQTVKLTADISGITTRTSNDLKNPFCGTFDGQGHTMNLNISVTTSDATSAPFGYIENATVKNLHITGTETTAGLRIASIAGFAKSSTITNCWSEVALSSSRAKDIDCGAFVARTESGSTVTLNGCLFTGSITYSNANGYEGGGMVGWAKGTVKLNDCVFAPSAITIAKYQSHNMFIGNASGTLTNCYYNDVAAASSLTVQGKQARNIIAGDGVIINGLGAVTTTYDVSGIAVYGKGLKYGDTFCAGNSESVTLDLNFSKTGCVLTSYTASGGTLANPTSNGPTLTMPDADVTIGATYRECAGTEADPYLITSTADWNTLSANVDNGKTYSGVYFSQTKDISVTTTLGPSTTNNSYKPFGGIYDGNGMTLDVTLNGSGECTAPFGCIQGATIKNLHITGSISTTGLRPASIASFCENSTITNCWSEVAISSSNGSDIDGGAFVGRVNENKSLTLNGCLFTGSITYSNANGYEGGGMVGYTQTGSSATLNNCVFAPSAISIQKYSGHKMFVGGKVLGTLTNCYYNDVAAASSLTKQAKQMRSITAGTDVTSLVISGNGTEYDVSGITAYATGIKYNDVYYAGNGESVSLTYSGTKSVKSVTAKRKTTTGNITVYFTDVLNYGDVHVYYWNDGPDWPGTPMTEVGTNEYSQKIYRAEIPAAAEGIIFNGNGRQTVDIIENIEDGSWWYTNEDTDDLGHNKVGYVGKYTIEVTNVDANNWTFTMPDFNVELDIEYYPAYPVTISDGNKDAANWSATPTEQSVGQNVTLQYTGRKKIKRITIVPAATARTAAEATAEDIGKLIGADGNIYDDAAAATAASTTAVAVIAYVGSETGETAPYNHGLALALSDANGGYGCKWSTTESKVHTYNTESSSFASESGLQYNTTQNTAEYPAFQAAIANNGTAAPTGCSSWFLASGYQWKKMAGAAGGYDKLGLQPGKTYWSSTEYSDSRAWPFSAGYENWERDSKGSTTPRVRACLAF